MTFILTCQEFDYPFALKCSLKRWKNEKKIRHILDDLQSLHTNG